MEELSNPSTSSTSFDQTQSILLSIEQYKAQLDEVNGAIESASEEDRIKLQELQLNLISILELTLSQLDQIQSTNNSEVNDQELIQSIENNDNVQNDETEDEFKKFKMEIAQLEGSKYNADGHEQNEVQDDKSFMRKIKGLETSLKVLEGQDVRVPFMERWGGFSYHNAIVMNLVAEDGQIIDYEKPQVLVLFSQPTSLSMLPCRFFLDGKCKFDSSKCKFSHGEVVAVEDLREYNEPDREKIVSGSSVLALHEGQEIWHRGKIEDVLEDRMGFSFSCSPCGNVFEVPLESMFPLYADGEDNIGRNEVRDKLYKPPIEKLEENSCCIYKENSITNKLGDWEKHTKGFGSKLMAKMGYVAGTGLGPRGEGRVDPVQVYVYPQGVSLDHCIRLREASTGDGSSLEAVEKRLLMQQKKENEKKNRQHKYLNSNTSVFDIINDKLASKNSPTTEDKPKRFVDTSKILKKDSIKELNKKNYHLSSSINKLKEEINTLNRSHDRQSKDPATMKAIGKKMEGKTVELSLLHEAFKRVESEQQNRKNRQKFCSF